MIAHIFLNVNAGSDFLRLDKLTLGNSTTLFFATNRLCKMAGKSENKTYIESKENMLAGIEHHRVIIWVILVGI